jgi:hypothetical protein
MKRVVSVSLGTDQRDHRVTLSLLGQTVMVERRGVNGNLERAESLIHILDGSVDAIGLGGIDRYLVMAGKRYEIADARRLALAAQRTPVVDGSGLKDTWERWIVEDLTQSQVINPSMSVLMVSAMDRFGMAEAFYERGYQVVAGDLIFASRINYPILTREELVELGRKLLPELVKLPFWQLYPTGAEQLEAVPENHYEEYFDAADIIAGDFHFIKRYMPLRLDNKIILTNTTTNADRAMLRSRGARDVVTTTPVIEGRSFGTNVVEALLVAISGLTQEHDGWTELVARARRELFKLTAS